jgi:hypothetical protein
VRSYQYEDWPRGRIVFDRARDLFILYADRKLMTPAMIARIETPDLRGSTYVPSFGAVEYAYPLTDRVHAFTLAQGPLVITAALPTAWKVRSVDENMCRADADNFPWANAV